MFSNAFFPGSVKSHHCEVKGFNPLPLNKILDQTKSKAFADDKLNVSKMTIPVFDRVENSVGKGEIACTSNFSFSHIVFKRLLSQTHHKVPLCGNGLTHYHTTNFRLFQTEKVCR